MFVGERHRERVRAEFFKETAAVEDWVCGWEDLESCMEVIAEMLDTTPEGVRSVVEEEVEALVCMD